jgi:hypothetical protein
LKHDGRMAICSGMTLDQCASALSAIAEDSEFSERVDREIAAYLESFRGDFAAVARERRALFEAIQDAPDFPGKGRVLDRLAGVDSSGG